MATLTFDQKLRRVSARLLMPGGFIVIGLALGLMIVFRWVGIIQTPWLIVLAPLWFPFALRFAFGLVIVLVIFLYVIMKIVL
jgi:hypothetical protein